MKDESRVRLSRYCRSNLGECCSIYEQASVKYKGLRGASINHTIYDVFSPQLHRHEFTALASVITLFRKALDRIEGTFHVTKDSKKSIKNKTSKGISNIDKMKPE